MQDNELSVLLRKGETLLGLQCVLNHFSGQVQDSKLTEDAIEATCKFEDGRWQFLYLASRVSGGGTIHELKLDPLYYSGVDSGTKPFEIRRYDRWYKVGDFLVLRETKFSGLQMRENRLPLIYTGRMLVRVVTYVCRDGTPGIAKNFCVLGLMKPAYAPCEKPV